MITITGPKQLTIPGQLGGDDSIFSLVLVCVTRGLTVTDSPGSNVASITGIKDTSILNLSMVELLVSNDAEVLGYPVFFEVEDIKSDCPFADSDWESWAGNSNEPINVRNRWYLSNRIGEDNEVLKASLWARWLGDPPKGVRLVSASDFESLKALGVSDSNDSSGHASLRTFQIEVDDADGAWSEWFNAMLAGQGVTNWSFGSDTGKPRITAPITDEQIAGYVDAFKAANPDYASIEYREIK